MPETIIDLGKRVKAKFPGQYDDLSDQEVGAKVKSKYPTEYADFADVKAEAPKAEAQPEKPASWMDVRYAGQPSLNDIVGVGKGAAKAAGDFVQTGGQWLESILGMPVSAPRMTATGRDVFQPNSTQEKIGKALGQVGMTVAGGEIAGPSLAAQVGVGGLAGALQNPDNPYPAAIGGMAAPVAAKAIPLAQALAQGRSAGADKFGQIAAQVNGTPINADKVAQPLVDADILSKTGSTPPKVVRDLFKWEGPIDYESARRFANRAGSLTAAERMETDPAMKRVVGQLYGALKDANREVAAKAGMGELYDEAMREFRIGSKGASMADALMKALKDHGAKAAVGAGVGYGVYRALNQ